METAEEDQKQTREDMWTKMSQIEGFVESAADEKLYNKNAFSLVADNVYIKSDFDDFHGLSGVGENFAMYCTIQKKFADAPQPIFVSCIFRKVGTGCASSHVFSTHSSASSLHVTSVSLVQ